jgi:aromatic-L-amino-acid decarboxylase
MTRKQGDLETPSLSTMVGPVPAILEEFLASLEQAPSVGSGGAEFLKALAQPPGDEPADLNRTLTVVRDAASAAVETAGPRYFGYIPGAAS